MLRLFATRKEAEGRREPPRSAASGPAVNRPVVSVPADTRVYAIGDIHGRLDLLRQLEAKIVAHAAQAPVARHVLVYIGDYVDRGYESRQVIDHLIAPPPAGFDRVCLKGNHEDFMLRFLDDAHIAPMWLVNGGRETLLSYGITLPAGHDLGDQIADAQARFRDTLPPAHLAFLKGLKLSHVEGGYVFVHAGVRPGVALEDQAESDLLWIRDEFLHSRAGHDNQVVVHGHTVVAEPEVQAHRIGIDTGAFATGRLTCLVLEGSDRGFFQT